MDREEDHEVHRDRKSLPDIPNDGVLVKTICVGLTGQKHIGDDEKQKIYSM